MNIYSDDFEMTAVTDNLIIKWTKGSHHAEVFVKDDPYGGVPNDVFTFAFEKNQTDMLDFTTSLQNYLEYVDEAN